MEVGSLERVKMVSEAITSVRAEATRALARGNLEVYSNRMYDLGALEMVLADETALFLKHGAA